MRYKPKLVDKRWSIEKELELIKIWEEEKVFEFDENSEAPIFSIDTPPPYASGSWHVAAAAHYCQFDMFARYYKMRGYNILFPMGIDRNGLPIEIRVEQEYGIRAKEVDREYFINLCKEKLDEYEKDIISIIRRMGMMARYWDPYRTDSPDYRALTQATFIYLWKKGLIYEDDRPTIWCPVCHTTIAEAEIEYKQREGYLYYIKFPLVDGGYVTIATTRPELIGATAALLYHPDDQRYNSWLTGKKALIPIYKIEIPILPHPIVDKEYGTGVMMLSSFGDLTDVRLFRELALEPRVLINKDGRMNKLAGKYEGLSVEEAREKIVADLSKNGYLEKVEKVLQNVPTCWRSHNPVEFIVTKDLYLKQLPLKEELKKIADNMIFVPNFHKKRLLDWIDSLTIDWAITRSRYYGTEVPLWYCKNCGWIYVPEPGKYYQPWKEKPDIDKCPKCGSTEFLGDPRTFDTWVDSSISALYISGYMRNDKLFSKAFPVTVRPQGIDIVRTWLYYSVLRIYLLTGKPPFKYVRLSGMGLDDKGRPMSKSLGNIVHPNKVFEKFGADAFRLWSASETRLGFDYRYSEKKVEAAKKFLTKLWNIARFVSMFPFVEEFDFNDLCELDKQIIAELNKVILLANEEYSKLDFFMTINELRNFVWNKFASHYIELIKQRAYNSDGLFSDQEQRGAWFTLHYVLRNILLIMHPVTPFITDYLWRKLYRNRNIVLERFPEPLDIKVKEYLLEDVMLFNSIVWKSKKEAGISLKDPVNKVITSLKLADIEKDLKAAHKIKNLEFRDDVNIDDTIVVIQ